MVLVRLNEHMDQNNLHTPEQFGYKKGHSTEHVVLEIVDEVLVGFDKRTATLVILLDLSAAFDTVDLKKLMQILEDEIHIKGTALSWFNSFLFGRHQKMMIGSSFSGFLETLFGTPQGQSLVLCSLTYIFATFQILFSPLDLVQLPMQMIHMRGCNSL